MMGWFTLRKATRKYESTTPDNIQWMLSKAAGYGAGFAFHMSGDALRSHGKTGQYLRLIAVWGKCECTAGSRRKSAGSCGIPRQNGTFLRRRAVSICAG